MKKVVTILTSISFVLLFSDCSSDYVQKEKNEVIVHELSDAEMLNPINVHDNTGQCIVKNIYQSLLDFDFNTLQPVAILAESRPAIEKTPEGGMLLTYRIRPEAKWDNGNPITAKDVEFTLKVIKNPKVNNQSNKPYYEFINDIKFYDDDPLKFTLVSNTVYILAEPSSGDYAILPEYVYDPEGRLKKFTIKQLTENTSTLIDDPDINAFANDFNSEKRMREKEHMSGSGAYKLTEWTTGQRIVLTKKENWWGDKIQGTNSYFNAFPEKLIYQTVNDQTSALVSLKAGNLDVMYSIKPKDFVELPKSEKFTQSFNSFTPVALSYYYFGINTALPKFSDKKVRQAIAHLCDVDKMMKTCMYGMGERVIGPVHPTNKVDYNTSITPYDYNVEKAKALLAEAGWKDTDGNGLIDKEINGVKTDFNINFTVNAGNDIRKQMALMFQEEARKVGIEVSVAQQDWSVYLNNQKKHNFEMYFGGWISSPIPNDFKQIFHTESILNEGSNYVSFGNSQTDALIDSIKIELDPNKRAVLNKRFQEILHEEVPYVFICAPSERIAIHKRFEGAQASVMRPGFWEAGFKTAQLAK